VPTKKAEVGIAAPEIWPTVVATVPADDVTSPVRAGITEAATCPVPRISITPAALMRMGFVAVNAPPFVVVAHVVQVSVPVVVIGPPPRGAVVAIFVTVPLPPPARQLAPLGSKH